jgi:hypothetical protein
MFSTSVITPTVAGISCEIWILLVDGKGARALLECFYDTELRCPLLVQFVRTLNVLAWYQDVTYLKEDSHPGQELLLWCVQYCGKWAVRCCDCFT